LPLPEPRPPLAGKQCQKCGKSHGGQSERAYPHTGGQGQCLQQAGLSCFGIAFAQGWSRGIRIPVHACLSGADALLLYRVADAYLGTALPLQLQRPLRRPFRQRA
jgi:hypothetical protein